MLRHRAAKNGLQNPQTNPRGPAAGIEGVMVEGEGEGGWQGWPREGGGCAGTLYLVQYNHNTFVLPVAAVRRRVPPPEPPFSLCPRRIL